MQTLQSNEQLLLPLLDAFEANICVIDTDGVIVVVNAAWSAFAINNGASLTQKVGVGASYLDVCRRAAGMGDPYALSVLNGLHDLLAERLPRFEVEYPCPAPETERYFLLTATPIRQDGAIRGAAIVHQNVSQFRLDLQDTTSLLEYYRSLVEGQAPRTARLLGDRPLRERLPDAFLQLVESYRSLLPRFLDSRVLRITPPRRELSHMAWHLGEAGASARDVIDLHVDAINSLVSGSISIRKNTLIIEGRLMALELMGYLADYYRHPIRQRLADGGEE